MTPKEKAKQLLDAHLGKIGAFSAVIDDLVLHENELHLAKQCALIVVEETIKNSFTIKEMLSRKGELDSQKLWYYIDDSAVAYWQKVKQELENYDR